MNVGVFQTSSLGLVYIQSRLMMACVNMQVKCPWILTGDIPVDRL